MLDLGMKLFLMTYLYVYVLYLCFINSCLHPIIDSNVYDTTEAQTLSMNRDKIDIFSLSWGPGMNFMTYLISSIS